ncbi:fibroblast growth factor receptor substrate 2 [Toxorhynchites rutilus septentrionalis]|uniref:fibroblast growth factor receptor substrate 2 n=1 Tax=Toxorhynchites rutilus septentrionalis TaxID=329112 RepID=UPI00247A1420|nr:fibroblast growth factor receptor substrate 2 [Toxorhynchites rutilus septentrionalis]
MGCINSKKDINDVHPNIFYVINIDDDGTPLWSGQLEVSRTELTLYRKGKDPTTWPLKCLRRYGYNVDQFSFEAGRRCTTGEGIYAFKCRRAETLFYTVQSYIQGRIYSDENTNPNDPYPIPVASTGPSIAARSVSQNNTATRSGQQNGTGTGSYIVNRAGIATSQSLSPNGTIHSNSNQSRSTDTLPIETNYLEPTPNRPGGQPQTVTTRFQQGLRLSSVSSGPVSPDVTSPGSPNSVTNILEVTTLNPLPANNAVSGAHHGVSNLYQEFPVKDGAVGYATNATAHRMSLDIPPQETAPAAEAEATSSTKTSDFSSVPLELQQATPEADPSRMYMNVNIACLSENISKAKTKAASKSNSSLISINNNSNSFDENQYQNVKTPTSVGPNMFAHLRMNSAYQIDPTRFYENLEPGELKSVLLRGRYSKPDIFANVDLPLDNSEPCTPTAVNRKVHYIVLDLDQANSSHNTNAPVLVTSPTGTAPTGGSNNNNPTVVNLNNPNEASPSNMQVPVTGGLLPPESPKKASLGYATIDFNKTFALSNSTTPSSELDSEGSRKTRHNSTVTPLTRQSNSVSD